MQTAPSWSALLTGATFPVYGLPLAQISNHTTVSQNQSAHLLTTIASGKIAHPRELEHILENLDCTFEDAVIKNPTNIIWGYGMMQYISEDCLKAEWMNYDEQLPNLKI